MTLYEAIFLKRTVRKFKREPLEQKLLDQLLNFANHLPMLCEGQRVKYKIISSLTESGKPIWRSDRRAPYYLLIYGDGTEECLLNAGFLMGQIGLYLLTKSVGCCYIHSPQKDEKGNKGGFFAIPFGRTERSVFQDDGEDGGALGTGVLSLCVMKETPDEDMLCVLESALLTPTCFARTPWRLVVYAGRFHIFMRRDVMLFNRYRKAALVDAGLMLANVFTAAEEMWLEAGFEKRENIALKEVKKYEYAGTVTLA